MKFIKPKEKTVNKTIWEVSDRTKHTVKFYAEYTGFSEDEVVDTFLLNILDDPDFIAWIQKKRRNTRIAKQLFPEEAVKESASGEN
ncbi:hypothetical protein BSK49_08740 [Paenibacillus odorifer]|jgi:hypothetical protein|uniref:Uncharacterized protein n=1 Tax=Paenibacillus odorifer TaxID=189426 RepID=A0ABX3GGT9_9BACL|nr:hypothetical protein [Paenibacillus odorifer]OMD05537.1 hypothetical protein BSO21_31295 [Paenibacillus odorifer]OMD90640.1 hypothetical protein BSK49_08740 [Paenibacillus odorifer]